MIRIHAEQMAGEIESDEVDIIFASHSVVCAGDDHHVEEFPGFYESVGLRCFHTHRNSIFRLRTYNA